MLTSAPTSFIHSLNFLFPVENFLMRFILVIALSMLPNFNDYESLKD